MAADNDDLPPFAYRSLQEMRDAVTEIAASGGGDVDLVIQLDLLDLPGIRRLHIVPRGTAVAAPTLPGLNDVPVLATLEDESVPPQESLARFLAWGIATYPAHHYGVIVSGHGQGWRPRVAPTSPPARIERSNFSGGIAWDQTQGTVLDVPGLREALAWVAQAHLQGRPFDLYISDACLMQSLEVATELAPVARFIVGSEQIAAYYLELDYEALLLALHRGSDEPPGRCPADDGPCRIAQQIPQLQWRKAARAPADDHARETLTSSTLDTRAVEAELLPRLGRLSGAVVDFVCEDPLRLIDLQFALAQVPDFLGGTRDLGVLLHHLEAPARGEETPAARRLREEIQEVREALARSVLARRLGTGYRDAEHLGMMGVSVWLPADEADLVRRSSWFSSSRFYDALATDDLNPTSAWETWMRAVFGQNPCFED